MKVIKSSWICIGVVAVLLSGCGGRPPNPVQTVQLGDEEKSCRVLEYEMTQIRDEISKRTKSKNVTVGKNVAIGVTGAVLFWPAFLWMDLKQADQIEIEALIKRHNALGFIATERRCRFEIMEIRVNDDH